MNKNTTERAQDILTSWQQRLSPTRTSFAEKPFSSIEAHEQDSRPQVQQVPMMSKTGQEPIKDSAIQRAEGIINRLGRFISSQSLIRATARGYVALAVKTQEVVDPISKSWQQSIDEARQERKQQAAKAGGRPAASREASEEKQGEQTLKASTGAATEAVSTAGEAAGA